MAEPSRSDPDSRKSDDKPSRVTMREIARQLGVSHASISIALRERPGISEALRQKIKARAQQLGYRPDPALSALNNYRSERRGVSVRAALGWINFWRNSSGRRVLREVEAYWKGAQAVAEKHGYHLYEFGPDAKNSLAAEQRVMHARNIEGLLLSPPEPVLAAVPATLHWADFSVVRYGHGLAELPFDLVTSAQATNTILAIRRMRERGYKRVGYVSSHYSNRNMQFFQGYLRAREDIPAAEQVPHLSLPELSLAEDDQSLKRWLDEHRPDAVFSNLSTIRARITACGYSVPGQVGLAVTSVQDCDADSGIDQCPMQIGRIGCETLISLLLHGHRGFPDPQREILVEGVWVDGESLPAKN